MQPLQVLLPLAQATSSGLPAAQEAASGMSILGGHVLAAVIFSVIGIIVLGVCILVMEKLTPFSIYHEIVEEHNQALGTIVGAIVLGISLIIAAAILG
ncbi:DUF350 domain-containing protein [Rhodopirellula sp. MGV]|uniref:DUF350 domain-containing protein n=1 Tax=Rhodopirellula sp. MGV TaxID=2023130 RepID=UPI000B9648FC|nr:DUF350 domain-containing protein [Rhodopirellula sp. MGV]OYP38170.1 hypothetical protein CGZ80_02770 [Rhodopirellula sp. MGV]PNY38504.1 DUF350 domain-containing protein [Rhodopirellula baltica]